MLSNNITWGTGPMSKKKWADTSIKATTIGLRINSYTNKQRNLLSMNPFTHKISLRDRIKATTCNRGTIKPWISVMFLRASIIQVLSKSKWVCRIQLLSKANRITRISRETNHSITTTQKHRITTMTTTITRLQCRPTLPNTRRKFLQEIKLTQKKEDILKAKTSLMMSPSTTWISTIWAVRRGTAEPTKTNGARFSQK